MKGFSDRNFFPGLRSVSRLCSLSLMLAGASGLVSGLFNPAHAQSAPSERQVVALSEALRQNASDGPGLGTGVYYSDWQVPDSAIPQWSKACLGRSLTPLEFATSVETAESVVLCQLREQLAKQYEAAGGNEAKAVQRVVAWWRTGDASRYQSGSISTFTKDVLGAYQKALVNGGQEGKPAVPTVSTTVYDRYMSAGYGAMRQGELSQAAAYFQRAVDERPKDTFAQNALRDVKRQARAKGGLELSEETREAETVNSQHWTEVSQNTLGDRTLVGPNSIKPVGDLFGYWEYRAFVGENNAFIPTPMDRPVRSALLYRLTSCDGGTVQTRVMKAYTDDRVEVYEQNFGVGAAVEEPKAGSATAKAAAFVCEQSGATQVIEEEAPIQVNG